MEMPGGMSTRTKILNGRVQNQKGTFGPSQDSPEAPIDSPDFEQNVPEETIKYIPYEELEGLDNPDSELKKAV